MATKLSLIDSELLLRLLERHRDTAARPPANPILREMSAIDDQMDRTLNNAEISDLAKARNVNALLSKHDNFSRQFRNQPPPMVSLEPLPESETTQQRDEWYAKIVNSVPQTIQPKAKHLLDHIKSSKNMDWDHHGRLIIDGKTVHDTNMLDLVHGVTRQRKSQALPAGAQQFLDALDSNNTARELMPNYQNLRKLDMRRRDPPRDPPRDSPRGSPADTTPTSRTKKKKSRSTPRRQKQTKRFRSDLTPSPETSPPTPRRPVDFSRWQDL